MSHRYPLFRQEYGRIYKTKFCLVKGWRASGHNCRAVGTMKRAVSFEIGPAVNPRPCGPRAERFVSRRLRELTEPNQVAARQAKRLRRRIRGTAIVDVTTSCCLSIPALRSMARQRANESKKIYATFLALLEIIYSGGRLPDG